MDPLIGLKIPSALQPLLDKASDNTAVLLRLLRPGQLLRATVLRNNSGGLAQLRIANATVTARGNPSLESGQKLLLEVEKGLPEPLLRIVRQPPPRLPLQQIQQHAMARQIPPAEVPRQLREIQQQMKRIPGTGLQRMPVIKRAMNALEPRAPDVTKLTSGAVRRAVQNSGLLMESLLVKNGSVPKTDHKLELLQLLRLLLPENRAGLKPGPAAQADVAEKPAQPPQTDQLLNRLMRLVEGSIARIQSHQAKALANTDEPNRLLWQVDLPIQVGEQRDHLELKIQQEQAHDKEGASDPTWKIEVRFDFQELGPVFSRITLCGKKLHCAFWSKKASTASRFEQALPRLEQALHDAGLEVSAVSSLQGTPQTDELPLDGLLDERA